MHLTKLTPLPKSGNKLFTSSTKTINFKLLDFWQWSTSDLLNNVTRGILAEYLVASDLGLTKNVRDIWGSYDLEMLNGTRIEVKSCSYIQSWNQSKLSNIIFGIKPTRKWNPDINDFEGIVERQSDFYIFCLLNHKNQDTIDPMNLDQWLFYVLATKILNENVKDQKSISLNSLLKFEPEECRYGEIKKSLLKLSNK